MYNEKTNKLELKLKKVFGENTSLAITNAKLGGKGYMVRIESQGIPVVVDAYKSVNKEAEELALQEFEKQIDLALEKKMLPTQSLSNYKKYPLSEEELDKVYQYVDMPIKSLFKMIKENTSADICRLDDGRYECVITCPYMNLCARSTAKTIKMAIITTIWVAHDILKPYQIKVGDWPIKTN